VVKTQATKQDRAHGALVGLACGDALGAPAEGYTPTVISKRFGGPLQDMRGGGEFCWRPGQTTDDTGMMLALARSIASVGGYDPEHALEAYVRWWETNPPGIGATVDEVLSSIALEEQSARAAARRYHDRNTGRSAGNGSLMRVTPLGLRYRADSQLLSAAARQDSHLTHHDPAAASACAQLCAMVAMLVQGECDPFEGRDLHTPSRKECAALAVSQPGYCLSTLAIASCALHTSSCAEEGIVWVVNLGADADTNAAVAGALLGAKFGGNSLPKRWTEQLEDLEELMSLADRLMA
jgi:ADP-ribosyl-[dinitrogen reductase] hydrolase